jgi:hypothetical protein
MSVDGKRVSVPVWAVYMVTAFVWPLWAALFVGVSAAAEFLGRLGQFQLPALAIGLSIILAAVLSYGLGTLVRPWAPARLWVVSAVWLALFVAGSLLGLLFSSARPLASLLNVLGPSAFATIGFMVGLHGPAGSARPPANEI